MITTDQPIGLIDKLRISELLASRLINQGHIHAEPMQLRLALGSSGSTNQAVIKNWILSLIETSTHQFYGLQEAETFVARSLREKLLEAFPNQCNL